MSNINVKTTSELLSALKVAKSGDVISLASGDYSSVNIKDIQISGNVTIQSANAGQPAVLKDLMVRDSKGLTFNNLELSTSGDSAVAGFNVTSSSNIVLNKLDVHGTLNGNPQDDRSLLLIRGSTNITVSNSEFQQGFHGVALLDNDKVTITNNDFHDLRTDGVRGGGTSNLTIKGNYFTDFYPVEGDHPDGIQLWTTNTTAPATNIVISDNVVNRGGGAAIQGIYVNDVGLNTPFEKVTITNNTVIGGLYNGIAINSVNGLTLQGNTVVGVGDQKSWIRVELATGAAIANNQASTFLIADTVSGTKSGNILTSSLTEAVAAKMDAWFDTHSTALATLRASFATAYSGSIAKIGYIDGPALKTAAAAEQVTFVEQVLNGTSGADRLTVGKVGDWRLVAGDGNDVLTGGGAGNHTLLGGKGDDVYTVKNLSDVVIEYANEGADSVNAYVDYTLTANVETLRLFGDGMTGHGNALDNRIVGTDGDDLLYGEAGNDTLQGGDGSDYLWGGTGIDTLRGEAGDDIMYGGLGDDTLYGDIGNDVLDGGEGGDSLWGGLGADRMTGGAGADTFLYRAGDFDGGVAATMDTIMDFSTLQKDKINLGLIDANTKTLVDDKFGFIGTSAFHKVAGELRYEKMGNDVRVMGDTNGDGVADFMIHLVGVSSLSAADFVL